MSNQKLNVFGVDVHSLMPIPPKSSFGLLIAIAIGLGIGLGIGLSNYKTTNSQLPVNSQSNGQFTRAEYERLQIGMQLVEVEAILDRGIETQSSTTTKTFVWKNSHGFKITATFTDGKLTHKKQTGF